MLNITQFSGFGGTSSSVPFPPGNPFIYFKAEELVSGSISSWKNKGSGGSAYDATVVGTITGDISYGTNGYVGAQFTGSASNYFSFTNPVTFSATVCACIKMSSTDFYASYVSPAGDQLKIYENSPADRGLLALIPGDGSATYASGSTLLNAWRGYYGGVGSSSVFASINAGTLVSSGLTGGLFSVGRIGQTSNGNILEWLLYLEQPTQSRINAVHAYFAAKFAI